MERSVWEVLPMATVQGSNRMNPAELRLLYEADEMEPMTVQVPVISVRPSRTNNAELVRFLIFSVPCRWFYEILLA